jgi:hypothetical protein
MDVVTITLRIALVGETPIGCAIDADGSARDFAGWLGLVAAIDGLLSDAPADTATTEETSW